MFLVKFFLIKKCVVRKKKSSARYELNIKYRIFVKKYPSYLRIHVIEVLVNAMHSGRSPCAVEIST